MKASPLPALVLLMACSEEGPGGSSPGPLLSPPTARWEQVEELRAGRAAPRHPGDGQGQARLVLAEGEAARITVSTPATWTISFRVGKEGIAEGGTIWFMPEPFWGWSAPQGLDPSRLGFTRIESNLVGVQFDCESLGALFAATVRGRALEEGEELSIIYGEGSGALSDRHSDRAARLWVAVDADGDGVRAVLEDSPMVEVTAFPPALLSVVGPTIMRPGESGLLRIAVLDALANRGVSCQGSVSLAGAPADWEIATEVELLPLAEGVLLVPFTVGAPAVARLAITAELQSATLQAVAAPIVVDPDLPRQRWADLHGHSGLSDGTGTPRDFYSYARDVAGLDAAALTDHDHFGVLFLDEHEDLWQHIQEVAREFHDPGRFITLPAFEWTSWIHGHRHVLFFEDEGVLISSLASESERPDQLWAALKGRPALTMAHHTSGAPIPTNWTFRPDPILEPLVEIASVHGSSESGDGSRPVRGSLPGHFVRDALDRGYELGFAASGDGHDGHPGLAHLSPLYGAGSGPRTGSLPGQGGVVAIWSEELSRESLLAALRARRTTATSGPRLSVHAWLDDLAPGQRAGQGKSLKVSFHGTAPLSSLVLVRDGTVQAIELPQATLDFDATVPLPGGPLGKGSYAYLRFMQADGATAWTSPWFGPAR